QSPARYVAPRCSIEVDSARQAPEVGTLQGPYLSGCGPRRLEERLVPRVDEKQSRFVGLLLARRRRWALKAGEPPAILGSPQDGRQTFIAALTSRRDFLAREAKTVEGWQSVPTDSVRGEVNF